MGPLHTTPFGLNRHTNDSHWENPYISKPLSGRQRQQPAENQSTKMIRNLAICLSFSCLVVSQAFGQQDPQMTLWFNDLAAFNIGAAGEDNLTHVSAWHREQWVNFNGAPTTTLLNVHSNVDFIPGALGLQLYQDEIGQETNTMVKLGYAYRLAPLSNGTELSFGLNLSLFSKSYNVDEWVAVDDWRDDPAIPSGGATGTSVDGDFGVFLRKPNEYYAGVSMTHVAEVQMSSLSITPARTFYFMGGYDYPLSGNDLVLRSNVLAKTDLAYAAIDVNVNVLWNDFVWGGLTYRIGDALAPSAGIQKALAPQNDGIRSSEQVIKVGYAYGTTLSPLSSYNSGSHEVFVSYAFKFETTPVQNKYANPRFL